MAKIRQAVDAVLLCAGAVLIPFLLALDGAVWLGCQQITMSACAEILLVATQAAAQH